MLCFDYQRDPLPRDYDTYNPEHRDVYRFVKILFSAAQVGTVGVCIVCFGYMWFFAAHLGMCHNHAGILCG